MKTNITIQSANITVSVERTAETLTIRHGNEFCNYVRVAGDWEPSEMSEFFSKHWSEDAEEELWQAIRNSVTALN